MLTLGPTLHDLWPQAGILLGMAAAVLLCVIFITRLPDVRRLPKGDEAAAQLDPMSGASGTSRTSLPEDTALIASEAAGWAGWLRPLPVGICPGSLCFSGRDRESSHGYGRARFRRLGGADPLRLGVTTCR